MILKRKANLLKDKFYSQDPTWKCSTIFIYDPEVYEKSDGETIKA